MKRKIFATIGLASALLLAACSGSNSATKEIGDIKALVNDYSMGNIQDEKAAITSHQLLLMEDDEVKEAYDLPEDEFFVAIAPYVNQTHT